MKKLCACLLAALLLTSLTACMAAVGGSPAPNPSGAAEETVRPEDAAGADLPEEAPEDAAGADLPEEAPEDAGDPLEGLSSAPAFAIYPEWGDEVEEHGAYTSKEDVALYIWLYDSLPENFITKSEARDLGWPGGNLEPYAPGMCIGGDRFGNREGNLPEVEGRTYYECDIDTLGASSRGAKRLVFCYETDSQNPQIYYTEDHYETFEMVYGDDAPMENAYD